MRITGGEFGSRALKAPKGNATRPTSDRVREALFSILGGRGAVRGRALDLYAGTGALGLEALSRGASEAVFVERAKEALVSLQANVEALGVRDRVRVLSVPVERAGRALENTFSPFSLIFADPPYADVKSGVALRALESVAVARLAEDGILVLEHASRDAPPVIAGLAHDEARTYGDTTLSFYVRGAHTSPEEESPP